MVFSLIIIYWSAKDGHSKPEVLEISLIWIREMLSLDFLFVNRPPIGE